MFYLRNSSRYFAFWLVVVFLSGNVLFGAAQLADAGYRGKRHKKKVHDSRYHHDRYYPARRQIIQTLPRGSKMVVHGGVRYHFSGGAWYRPKQSRFVIVAPPIGIVIPFLPPYYTMIKVGGGIFYYANDVYYTHCPDGYVVVAPPKGEVSQVPPSSSQLFIYPRKGQNEKQQADDRYACHSWAVNQTGYDPTLPDGEVPEADRRQTRADYHRAMSACLEARGYAVK